MSESLKIKRSKQIDEAMRMLTDGTFSKMTGRKVPSLSREQAAAYLGNVIHETGSYDLSKPDQVEIGSGAGRGLAQYTGARREAYDRAMQGKNANDIRTQLQYAADEYVGKHDPAPGQSLVGYTKALEKMPRGVGEATNHLLDTYFRPADPSASRNARHQNAQQILKIYQPPQNKPKPQPKPQQQPNILGQLQGMLSNFIPMRIGNR